MDRTLQRIGLLNFLALLGAAAGGVCLARFAGSSSGLAGAAFLLVGVLIALVTLFQMRLVACEHLENLEVDELNRRSGERAPLFTESGVEPRAARRAREQFERVVVPVFTALLVILEGGAAIWLWQHTQRAPAARADAATLSMAAFAVGGFLLYLLGKYAAGLAKLAGQRLLQPGAAYLLLSGIVCFAVAIAEAFVWFGIPKMDRFLAFALVVVLVVVVVETLFNLVLEIYRPRVKGQTARLLYESRLMGLTMRPEGFFRTAAQALDYQFGFRVSETWFYRFLERAISWLILLQLGVLLLFTTFVIIEPGEQALLERLGRPVDGREVLDAGIHFKLPWPIDRVYRVRTRGLQQVSVGAAHEDEKEHSAQEKVIVWVKSHEQEEFNFLVASGADSRGQSDAVPVNLLTLTIPIQFEVTNVVAWARGHGDGAELLERIATREVTRYLVNADYDRLLAEGRVAAGKTLRERVQRAADERELGVRIVFVGMQDIHPPAQVAAAYEAVVGAAQEKASKIHVAEGARAEGVPLARAEAVRKLAEAESYRLGRVAGLAAAAAQFSDQVAAFDAAPTVYLRRAYLETVSRNTASVRKLVLGATNTQDVINLNLEEKIRADLLDVTVPPPAAPK